MKFFKVLAIASVTFFVAGIALANGPTSKNSFDHSSVNQTANPYDHHGAYIEGNIGQVFAEASFDIDGYRVGDTVRGGLGANVNGGYQFNRYFALEGGYTYYGHSVNMVDVAAKGIIPITNRFNIFGKIGPGYLFTTGSNSGSTAALFGGIGAAYALTPSLDINIQGAGATEGFFSFGLASLGLTYHFQ